MPGLSVRETNLFKLLIKLTFFNCPECIEDVEAKHDSHKIDLGATWHDMALSLGYLDMSLIGKNINYEFLDFLQPVIDELVAENFLTPMDHACGGCGGLMYVRTDTMKYPSSVMAIEDEFGKMCRFA